MNIIWVIIFFLCQVRCEWIFFEYELPNIEYEGVEEKIIALTKKAEEEEMKNKVLKEQKRNEKTMRKLIRKNEKYKKKYCNLEKKCLEMMEKEKKMAGHSNVPQVPYQFPVQPGMHPCYPGYTVPVACDCSVGHQLPVPIYPQQIPQHPGPMHTNHPQTPNNAIPGNHLPISQQQGAVPVGHSQTSHPTAPLLDYPPQMPCYPVPGNHPQQLQHQGGSNHPGPHTSTPTRPYAAASSHILQVSVPVPSQCQQNPASTSSQSPQKSVPAPLHAPDSNNRSSDNGDKDQKKDVKKTPPVAKPRGANKSPALVCS